MNTAIFAEAEYFFTSLAWGALLFLMYDGILIIRNIIRHGKILIAIEDICFWITSGVLIFRMMYLKNNGTIRWYAVLGIIIGMNAYHFLLSRFLVTYVTKALKTLIHWIKKTIHILLTPGRLLLKQIRRFYRFVYRKSRRRADAAGRIMQKQLKKHQEKVTIKKKTKEEKKRQEQQAEQGAKPDLPEIKKGCLELIPVSEEKGEVIEDAGKKEKTKTKKKKNRT
ncbi:MAG: hypothetical protein E7256_05400 [Lachnospiraceae bacterium]|nr:hypothetical protein [Lachnospiraceae bacterium]